MSEHADVVRAATDLVASVPERTRTWIAEGGAGLPDFLSVPSGHLIALLKTLETPLTGRDEEAKKASLDLAVVGMAAEKFMIQVVQAGISVLRAEGWVIIPPVAAP